MATVQKEEKILNSNLLNSAYNLTLLCGPGVNIQMSEKKKEKVFQPDCGYLCSKKPLWDWTLDKKMQKLKIIKMTFSLIIGGNLGTTM